MNQTRLTQWLDAMQAQLTLDEGQRERLLANAATPWWLSALLGVAAWFAALFIASAFLAPVLLWVDGPLAMGLSGLLLLAAALWLFRRNGQFAAQLALAFSLAGQALLVFALAGEAGLFGASVRAMALVGLILAAGLLLPQSSAAHRLICSLLVLGNLAILIGFGPGLVLYGLALAALAAGLWLGRSGWAASPLATRLKALAHAATLLAALLALYGHDRLTGSWLLLFDPEAYRQWSALVYRLGAALILLGVVAWLVRPLPRSTACVCLAAVAVLALLANQAPGLLVSAALWLAVFHASSRVWSLLMGVFAALYLSALYYSLHISLLDKSLLLIASGVGLLVLRVAARRLPGRLV